MYTKLNVLQKIALINNLPNKLNIFGQIKIKSDWLYNWIAILITFIKNSEKLNNNKDMNYNISIKLKMDLK